ncbi:hypothetical protein F7R20_22510 [Pseudomonas brassicacearum subsp. brassicacearum]|nr:hypothetical protein F7R20_22510 [Pseudomonas brassicacearum subsp. brassicacearum]
MAGLSTGSANNPMWERAVWEQGLPAMKTPRSLEDRSAWIASKLCSHTARSHRVWGFPLD